MLAGVAMTELLFPFGQYWWFYGVFTAAVIVLLGFDLGLAHRRPHVMAFKEAVAWSAFFITLAMLFALFLNQFCLWQLPQDPRLEGADHAALARKTTLQFLAGYVVEFALSVDNLFVFMVIFRFFAVPPRYQKRILFYGILGALVFRGLFIAAGAALMRFHWVVVAMGVFLMITGVKLLFVGGDEEIEPEKNWAIRLLKRRLPITGSMEQGRFFLRENGVLCGTPLLVCLVFVEVTDIVFAVDSVPAIFAVTNEPLVVFTSNVFAILGLRALYFVLAGMMDMFRFLKYGLGLVLVFVGLKMAWLNHAWGGEFPIAWSLQIIGGTLLLSVLLSLAFPEKKGGAKPR
jgi:tellurite resistance protein TerC